MFFSSFFELHIPTTFILANLAALTPASESSKTIHSSQETPSSFAPLIKTSGSGLELTTSLPSIITSKYFVSESLFKTII